MAKGDLLDQMTKIESLFSRFWLFMAIHRDTLKQAIVLLWITRDLPVKVRY